MKKLILLCATFLGCVVYSQADTITEWNFNSPTVDTSVTTGTLIPSTGSGSLTNIGGTTNSFGAATNGATSTWSRDPAPGDNSGLRLGQFPAATAANKTAGIELFASTAGYEGIQIIFDQENSATASRYWRAQYTTNGTDWLDHTVFESAGLALTTSWLTNRVVDLSTVAGVKDNPNFGFRYVSEWTSTATGSGANAYSGNSGNYGVNGTLWLDMVTVSGTVLNTNNTDPTITAISNQTVHANQTVGPLAFTIGDAETPAASLTLSYTSSNPALISNVSFGGSGASRTVTLVPEPNQAGSSTITVIVTDAGNKAISSTFSVVVRPPSIAVSNQTMRVNTSRTIPLTIAEYGAFQGTVTVTADSVDTGFLPPGSLVVSGSGGNRFLTITPAADQVTYALVSVSATDGALSITTNIFLNVVSSTNVALWNFNSPLRDLNNTTGTTDPTLGTGSAQALVAVGSFGTAGTSSDLDGQDNSKWRLGTFPAQNTGNKTGGVEFRLSTVGFQDINVSWDHYNSATCSRYWRVQYSTNGTDFIDALSYSNLVVTTFFPMSTTFTGLPGVDNNPNFAIRLVSEFESTAIPGSTNGYVGVQASGGYSTAGTLWLDNVVCTGQPYVGPETLKIAKSGNNIVISWPSTRPGTLQSTSTLSPVNWQTATETPVIQNGEYVVTISNPTGTKFYRLSQ